MTRKEFWLKLFQENDFALTSALVLLERFASQEQIERGKGYIQDKIKDLYEQVPQSDIEGVFGIEVLKKR